MTTTTTYEKMDPKVKKVWVAALRSGEYKQGRTQLCDANDRFCCLGVLIDACIDEEWVETTAGWDANDGSIRTGWGVPQYPGVIFPSIIKDGSLPERLKKEINLDIDAEDQLIELNDGQHWGFKRIATWIEKNL